MALSTQPQQVEMGFKGGAAPLPESLKYFAGLDEIVVVQKIEAIEILTGFETRNRYAIDNKEGQQIFFVEEESDACERCYNPLGRGFQLHVTDNNQLEVMRFSREFKWCLGCCCCGAGCCNMTILVEHPVGNVIGKISTGNATCHHNIMVFDKSDNHLYTVWATCCPCQTVCCTDDIDFPITDPSLTSRVGNIAKQWRGCCMDTFTNADQFSLKFPATLSVDHKALMLGALFTVEYLIMEQQKNNGGQ